MDQEDKVFSFPYIDTKTQCFFAHKNMKFQKYCEKTPTILLIMPQLLAI